MLRSTTDLGYVFLPLGIGFIRLSLIISNGIILGLGIVVLISALFLSGFDFQEAGLPIWFTIGLWSFIIIFFYGIFFIIAMFSLFVVFIILHKKPNRYSDSRKIFMILVGIGIYLLLSSVMIYGYSLSKATMSAEEAHEVFTSSDSGIPEYDTYIIRGKIEDIWTDERYSFEDPFKENIYTHIILESEKEDPITYLYQKDITDEFEEGDRVLITVETSIGYGSQSHVTIDEIEKVVTSVYLTAAIIGGIAFLILAVILFKDLSTTI
ncbi:MAG: hypothetical protein ACOCTK_02015 [Candidatus Saliniplasma sp.]